MEQMKESGADSRDFLFSVQMRKGDEKLGFVLLVTSIFSLPISAWLGHESWIHFGLSRLPLLLYPISIILLWNSIPSSRLMNGLQAILFGIGGIVFLIDLLLTIMIATGSGPTPG